MRIRKDILFLLLSLFITTFVYGRADFYVRSGLDFYSDAVGYHADVGLRTDLRSYWKSSPDGIFLGTGMFMDMGNSFDYSFINPNLVLTGEYDIRITNTDFHCIPGIAAGIGIIDFYHGGNNIRSWGCLTVPSLKLEWVLSHSFSIGLETSYRYFLFNVSGLSCATASLCFSYLLGFEQREASIQEVIHENQVIASNRQEFSDALLELLNEADIGATVSESVKNEISLNCSDILFDFSKTNVNLSYTNMLSQIARIMNHYSNISVIIEGYSDNIGGAAFNRKLSEDRAKNVAALFGLFANPGVRITSVGKGMENPLFPNNTDENRAKNRRVKIRFLWKR